MNFKQKLRRPHVGLVYWRIWGNPIPSDESTLEYWRSNLEQDPLYKNYVMFPIPGNGPPQYMVLYAERCVHGYERRSDGKEIPYSQKDMARWGSRRRRALGVGYILHGGYWKTRDQAMRHLEFYRQGQFSIEMLQSISECCEHHYDCDGWSSSSPRPWQEAALMKVQTMLNARINMSRGIGKTYSKVLPS